MAKKAASKKSKPKDEEEEAPEVEAVDEEEDSVYDSEDGLHSDDDDDEESDEDDFEDQGSSDDDDERLENQQNEEDGSDDEIALSYEQTPRKWTMTTTGKRPNSANDDKAATQWMHADDWSSDDEDGDGKMNRIGRVPLHWYEEYDHIGYDAHGEKVIKSASAEGSGDRIDQALAHQDNRANGKYIVHDALNDRNVELSARQLELIRRVQAGAYAHPEHDANPEYIDYFSGVDKEISGLSSNRYEPKARFQPSKYEKMQVDRLLQKLQEGKVNMDYLTGKIRDMRDAKNKGDPNKPFMMWEGDEEDLLNMRKGPQHIAAPKVPPPGHAASYIPPDEYLPTEEELKQWEEMEPKDRPHGLLIPKKFPNLRSVGAYEHSVREAFERCLDLYLCPRVMKRRLNIDPESLVPRLPRANDLRPFPTAKCIEYETPFEEGETAPVIRCVAPSPDGQFLASGATDGIVRLWEVQTGRLLDSWNLSTVIQDNTSNADAEKTAPIVSLEWNPNRSHHCLLAAVGRCVVLLSTGTAGQNDTIVTQALLASALQGGSLTSDNKASKAVKWIVVVDDKGKAVSSAWQGPVGPVCVLQTNREVSCLRWHVKGDYFVSVSPKAGAAAVLIHQLSKGNTQQPFSKAKYQAEKACFHPNKPFLFVASPTHVRVYHLVKQNMAKRLVSGCRYISSLDVHPSGDHLLVGSLDRRLIWFDMDLGATPYKTLKYHERAIRSVDFSGRYPLSATASDDGTVHVFHSMVYNDLMRNPLIVPVKVLRGHVVTKKLGVLTVSFHPTQPWLFTGGADGKIFLWQDI